ncbi:MAG: ferrous iron transporter B [Candidatus Kapabacteria bacterium]|nr:ferrous iron transporter B [Candidatus Kapabacteria bacterium]
MSAPLRVAVVGTPNVGKSTLFNELTGLQQKVGNFPGVTVEPLIGRITEGGETVELIDLPGIYGFSPTSEDEKLTVDVLRGHHGSIPAPDAVLLVMNAASPDKCLVLFSQLASTGLPVVVASTMVDTVKAGGGTFDDIGLGHRLAVPVVPVVGRKGIGVGDLRDTLMQHAWTIPEATLDASASIEDRFAWAHEVSSEVLLAPRRDKRTERLDAVLLHPVWGTLTFLIVMGLFFQSIFTWAQPLMDLIDSGVGMLQSAAKDRIDQPLLQSFVTNGIIGGVGSVIVFLPQILLLNLLVTFLEECGYLARAAFLVDRAMGLFGLQGRSFIPLLGSFACAIPGIMSARIIPSYRDRMATIMATPLMTCSARLPVYLLLISAIIPATSVMGVVSLQALVMAGLYGAGALSGLLIALVLKRTLFRGGVVPFLIEFPPYRLPSAKSIGVTMVNRSMDFLKTAGTVILAFSVALWILTELPRADVPEGTTEIEASRLQIEQSYAADLGRTLQPVFAPLGFDWRLTLGVLSSYAARETFVSAMGQIYAADVHETDAPLRKVLSQRYSISVGLSLLAFYVFALQCISTMAIMKRETGSWKWPALAFVITFVLAYGSAWIVGILSS